jgi:hypothetical protein
VSLGMELAPVKEMCLRATIGARARHGSAKNRIAGGFSARAKRIFL